jgi:hypothetical protein
MLDHIKRIDAFIARLDTQYFLGAEMNDIANEYFPNKIIGYGRSRLDHGDEMYFIFESDDSYSEAFYRTNSSYSLNPCISTQHKIRNFFESARAENKETNSHENPPEGIKQIMSDLKISTPYAIINDISYTPDFDSKTLAIFCNGRKLIFKMDIVHISPKQAKSVSFSDRKIESIHALCETMHAQINESKTERWNFRNIEPSHRPPTYPGVDLGPSHTYNEVSTLFQKDAGGRSAFCRIFICVFPKVDSVEFTQTDSDPFAHLKFTENSMTFSVFLDTNMNFRLKCM